MSVIDCGAVIGSKTVKLVWTQICTCFGITKLHTGTIHQAIRLHRSWEKGEEKIVIMCVEH
jgi:hypothetical protein